MAWIDEHEHKYRSADAPPGSHLKFNSTTLIVSPLIGLHIDPRQTLGHSPIIGSMQLELTSGSRSSIDLVL
jgi:hypothetical protein